MAAAPHTSLRIKRLLLWFLDQQALRDDRRGGAPARREGRQRTRPWNPLERRGSVGHRRHRRVPTPTSSPTAGRCGAVSTGSPTRVARWRSSCSSEGCVDEALVLRHHRRRSSGFPRPGPRWRVEDLSVQRCPAGFITWRPMGFGSLARASGRESAAQSPLARARRFGVMKHWPWRIYVTLSAICLGAFIGRVSSIGKMDFIAGVALVGCLLQAANAAIAKQRSKRSTRQKS